jgi:hypothetical protein
MELFLDKHQGENQKGQAFGFIGLKGDDHYQGWFFTWPGPDAEITSLAEREQVLDSLDADETSPHDPQIPHQEALAKLEEFLTDNFVEDIKYHLSAPTRSDYEEDFEDREAALAKAAEFLEIEADKIYEEPIDGDDSVEENIVLLTAQEMRHNDDGAYAIRLSERKIVRWA